GDAIFYRMNGVAHKPLLEEEETEYRKQERGEVLVHKFRVEEYLIYTTNIFLNEIYTTNISIHASRNIQWLIVNFAYGISRIANLKRFYVKKVFFVSCRKTISPVGVKTDIHKS
ncbi:hypothetical protein ACJX0J_023780, partial [Zea mays]